MTVSILIVVLCASFTVGLVLAIVRLAYLAGLAEAKTLLAQQNHKRIEDAARAVQDFDSKYVDLLDEDLRHRLRNL